MKKSLFTSVAVAALVFGIGTGSAFANSSSNFRGNPFGHHTGGNFGRNFEMGNHQMPGMGHFHGGIEFGKSDLLGTVVSVSLDSKTIIVKDADGKETSVHVNPLTRIHNLPEKPSAEEKSERKRGERPEISEVKLADLKKGDWVAVRKMDTETKTIEAARILVAKEK